MHDFYALILALFSSFGVISLVWVFIGFLVKPKSKEKLYVFIYPSNQQDLTEAICQVEWMRQWGESNTKLVVISDYLDESALNMANIFLTNESVSLICQTHEIEGYICKNKSKDVYIQ